MAHTRAYFVFLLLMLFLCIDTIQAQETIGVSGTVFDSKTQEALIGVTVQEEGTTNGTITDFDGKFQLNVSKSATLNISYMGYDLQRIEVNNRTVIQVSLSEKSEVLDELVVTGYGMQRKSDITGSISSVSGEDVSRVPVSSPLQALQGKAAGVNIIQNTGAPGGATTIKIRGTGTVNDADPLYVVDGFIVDDINHINSTDIKTIEILKDAASSAIYGARAANGVVLITTKSGESGETKITFDSFVGVSNPWKEIDVLNVEEYALMSDYIHGLTTYSEDGQLYMSKDANGVYTQNDKKYFYVDTIRTNSPANWWDAVTQTGIKHQYNLSISGGNEKNKYIATAGYYDEDGIVKTSDYKRFNARLNLNNQVRKWLNLNSNVSYINEKRNIVPEGQNSLLKRALYQNPLIYTYNSMGGYSEHHPIAVLDRNHNKFTRNRIDLNFSLTANVTKWLTYQFKVSDYLIMNQSSNFGEVHKLDESFAMTDLTSIYKKQTMINKWEINNLLTFAWKNNVHDITVLAGQILEGYYDGFLESTKKGTPSNEENYHYISAGYTGAETYGLDGHWSAMGFIGRLNYNLLNRYLLQANVRADASSVFNRENRW